jgi:hypothetical protein
MRKPCRRSASMVVWQGLFGRHDDAHMMESSRLSQCVQRRLPISMGSVWFGGFERLCRSTRGEVDAAQW